ncbi:MAG: hypothetical protein A2Y45_01715 [Tenericutes bacterium GWC2_34_14]|nr:MAG: hypothetical protein A2Y45_01715 [Tenericutes bacterium GWC2_34_14]OHE33124.1 MAG: hypothetical protein A2012_00365 [Tenericutes bacterium GWE2_34_108]OHE36244.1 MAG: hypothetical protein A2Y46_07355 [Tenericutes bacterium GWF1_35_14]OHE38714.1 MAG: hypothetical protein A2Y44_04875 [Tenericutes bacterium GWF2_35_184]OHE43042.1 MAG: hypothetical protein A3K26_00045 [Tenericutes bacterium RIFOXYA12_FULL_35_10]OHE44786.1 MAG: hypothetical protein A2221_01020 [Tenericutes bacterium RIFOXYA
MFENIKTVIFDWDGTLHESMHIYEKAFLKGYQHLIDQGYVEHKAFTSKEISSLLGKNPMDMWQSLCPTLDKAYIQEASQIISKEMLQSIERNEAKLYPNVEDVLTYLKEKGYTLVYLSNSKNYYMEAMRKSFQLDRFFDLFLTSEMYNFIPKKMILKEVIHNLQKEMVMIGDRDMDIETAQFNAIKSIGCLYGYGNASEFVDADCTIHDIIELKTIL